MDIWTALGMALILIAMIGGGLLYLSAVVIVTGTVGARFWLGEYIEALEPGLHFLVPIPAIDRAEIYSTAVHQYELPDDPPFIDRENNNPEEGKTKPFRVNHQGRKEAVFYVKENFLPGENPFDNTLPVDKLKKVHFSELPKATQEALLTDSLHAPLAGEYAAILEWSLKANQSNNWEGLRQFIENVNPEGDRDREEEVRKRASDLADRILSELLAPITFGHARYMMPVFNQLIKKQFEQLVGEEPRDQSGIVDRPWGIHVTDGYFKSPYPGRRVNEAQADAAAAESRKEETIRNAEADAEATRIAAEANGNAIRTEAEARAHADKKYGEGKRDRINAEAEALKSEEGKLAASLDVAVAAFSNGNTAIVPMDLAPLAGMAAFAKQVGKNTNP